MDSFCTIRVVHKGRRTLLRNRYNPLCFAENWTLQLSGGENMERPTGVDTVPGLKPARRALPNK